MTKRKPVNFKLELEEKMADQYIKFSKTKAELLIIKDLLGILQTIQEPVDKIFINSYNWTRRCIWQAIHISYHKLFSEGSKSDQNEKILKYQINADEYFKNADEELANLHEKILSVRHHFFVHGGSDLYEKYKLIADITILQEGSRIQLQVEGEQMPAINDEDIPLLIKLLDFLLSKLEVKLEKCNQKIAKILHEAIEKL